MFSTAKTLDAPKKGAAKKQRTEVSIFGLVVGAALDKGIKLLTALKVAHEQTVKTQGMNEFINMGLEAKKQPENFRGIEGAVKASIELRRRAVTSPCEEAEVELLTKYGIPTREEVTVIEAFLLNPIHMPKIALLERIENLLRSDPEIPEDLFVRQAKVSKIVVADDAIDVAFKTLDRAQLVKILPLISVPAVKYSADGETKASQIVDTLTAISKFAMGDAAQAALQDALDVAAAKKNKSAAPVAA